MIVNSIVKNDFTNSIYVMTLDEDTEEIEHYEINDKKVIRSVEEFKVDEAKIINVKNCYDFYINHNGTNELTMDSCTLLDNNNNEKLEITNELQSIIENIAEINYDILHTKIFNIKDNYYIVVELNVNLWSPYRLYYFDKDNYELKEIYTFDGKDVVGIKVNK